MSKVVEFARSIGDVGTVIRYFVGSGKNELIVDVRITSKFDRDAGENGEWDNSVQFASLSIVKRMTLKLCGQNFDTFENDPFVIFACMDRNNVANDDWRAVRTCHNTVIVGKDSLTIGTIVEFMQQLLTNKPAAIRGQLIKAPFNSDRPIEFTANPSDLDKLCSRYDGADDE